MIKKIRRSLLNNQPNNPIGQKQISASCRQCDNGNLQNQRSPTNQTAVLNVEDDNIIDNKNVLFKKSGHEISNHGINNLSQNSREIEQSQDESAQKTEKNEVKSCRTLLEKIKTMKNYQIFVALVIAVIIILIYFSVNAIIAKPKTQNVAKGNQSQLEKVISQIDGVGYCNIVITYNKNGSIHQSSEVEDNVEVFGVVVVAEGGDNVYVKMKLTDALCALLKIKSNNIKIYKSK